MEASAPEPELRPGEALIRPTRKGIDIEDLAAAGAGSMFQGVLGHEFVGVVERVAGSGPAGSAGGGASVARRDDSKWVGKRVVGSPVVVCGSCDRCRSGLSAHCRARSVMGLRSRDGCFAERFALPVRNLHEVPRNVDDDTAVFALAVAGALHAAQVVRIEGRPYVTVLGDSVDGLLSAQVMARLNASVRLLGREPALFGLCERWGVKHRHVDEVGRRQDQDVVVDCTGESAGLELATQLLRPRGKVVVRAAAGGDEGRLGAVVAAVHENELEVHGARGENLGEALHMLGSGAVDVSCLVSARARLTDGPDALRIASKPGQVKVLLAA